MSVLIGKGAFGYVTRPPIDIPGANINYNQYNHDKYIGKLFKDEDDFKKEYDELLKIAKIDPRNSFTIPLKAISSGVIDKAGLDPSIKRSFRRGQYIYQLILEYGGEDVNKRDPEYSITFLEFLSILKQLVKGINKLGKNDIVHQDIKPLNVLFDKDNKKLNVIDFGLAVNVANIYSTKNGWMSSMYVYHPPDYYIFACIMHESNKTGLYTIKNLKIILEKIKNNLYNKESEIYKRYKSHYVDFLTDILAGDKSFEKYFFDSLIEYIIHIEGEIDNGATIENDINSFLFFIISYIFTFENALKTDIYPMSYIIIELSKKVGDITNSNIEFVRKIFYECITCNSFKRITSEKLIEVIEDEEKKNKISQGGRSLLSNTMSKIVIPEKRDGLQSKSAESIDNIISIENFKKALNLEVNYNLIKIDKDIQLGGKKKFAKKIKRVKKVEK